MQAQTSSTAVVDPTLPYVFQDLTADVQWKGGVATACVVFAVFLVVLIRDILGVFDFGKKYILVFLMLRS